MGCYGFLDRIEAYFEGHPSSAELPRPLKVAVVAPGDVFSFSGANAHGARCLAAPENEKTSPENGKTSSSDIINTRINVTSYESYLGFDLQDCQAFLEVPYVLSRETISTLQGEG